MKRFSLFVAMLVLFVSAACSSASNPLAPDPTPSVGALVVRVNGEQAGKVDEALPFPTSLDGPVSSQYLGNPGFNVQISFPSTPTGFRAGRYITWKFGDHIAGANQPESVYSYGCLDAGNQSSCERALNPTKKYWKAMTYTATIVAENCVYPIATAKANTRPKEQPGVACTSQTQTAKVTVNP